MRIERSQFGNGWPLTVPWATLRCYSQTWLTVTADGCERALNGLARSLGFPPIDPIWAGDGLIVPRKNIGPLFEAAREKLGHSQLSVLEVALLLKPRPRSE
jgi:hypothetical protein